MRENPHWRKLTAAFIGAEMTSIAYPDAEALQAPWVCGRLWGRRVWSEQHWVWIGSAVRAELGYDSAVCRASRARFWTYYVVDEF